MANWKGAEYFNIILGEIPFTELGNYLRETLGVRAETVKSSLFFNETDDTPVYADSFDLAGYLRNGKGFSLRVKAMQFDREYRDVTALIYPNNDEADIDCDIAERNFDKKNLPALQEWLTAQVQSGAAGYACINYTADTAPLFEIRRERLL